MGDSISETDLFTLLNGQKSEEMIISDGGVHHKIIPFGFNSRTEVYIIFLKFHKTNNNFKKASSGFPSDLALG
jgi:hypothetical protein